VTLYGIDIGKDQWGINMAAVPHDFAIIGASDGGAVNPVFHQQYATEKALGRRRGTYHFFRGNPAAEAAFFVANAREVFGDGQVWCDAETFFPDLPQRTLGWLRETERLSGFRPAGVYTPADFLLGRGLDWSPVHGAGYALWEAAYVLGYQHLAAYNIPGGRAPVPSWGSPEIWQFTSSGIVPGWTEVVDLNVFYGDGAAFDALIAPGVTTTGSSVQAITGDPLINELMGDS
jgi:lysozyme